MKKKIVIGFIVFLAICFVLIFRPVPIIKEEKALVISGVIEKMRLTKGNDFVFKLKDDPVRYYINRGIEAGLNYSDFEEQLLHQEVTFKYPKYWTPLDWNNTVRHISKVEKNGITYFNEFADKHQNKP